MTDLMGVSRRFAGELEPGEHRLDNARLRDLYGLSRISGKARGDIVASLSEAGLEIVGDPTGQPLVVRKVQRQRGSLGLPSARTPWYRRRWVLALGCLLLLLAAVSVFSSPPEAEKTAGPPAAATQTEPTASTASDAPPAEPTETFADAVTAANDDDYVRAVAVAVALGGANESRIRRKISRRLATRARSALRSGNRGQARRLLSQADEYPSTTQTRSARAQLAASTRRASQRRADARDARRQAEQRRVAARDERRRVTAQRRAEQKAAEDAEAVEEAAPPEDSTGGVGEGTCAEVGQTNFAVPPGDERDADGDGIACEG